MIHLDVGINRGAGDGDGHDAGVALFGVIQRAEFEFLLEFSLQIH